MQQLNRKPFNYVGICLLWVTLFTGGANGAESELDPQEVANSAAVFWYLVIAILVITVTAASAALPIAATKQWKGGWRIAAVVPLAILGLWIAVIVIGKVENPESQRLWALEIFAWAMLSMIYMVAVMTVKRVLDKADRKNL